MQSGDRLELDIAQPVAGGRMLARHNGQVVLVAGAIPGERVVAAVERATRQMVWAHAVEVRQPSPDRRDPGRDPSCGGLTYAHIRDARQRALKAEIIADAFRRIAKQPLESLPSVAASSERGYRLRARLHVSRQRAGRLRADGAPASLAEASANAGFFREGTHDLCDARQTGQLTDAALDAVDATIAALRDRAAECESVIVAENVAATERVVHVNGHPGARLDDLASTFELPSHATGVTVSTAGHVSILAGSAVVTDTAEALCADGSASWTRHAASFFQGNRFLTGTLLERVLAHATGERIADLYSGVGLFAVALAARGALVLAVEGDRTSGADLLENAEPWRERLDVVRLPVEEALQNDPAIGADTIVVDPPRTGLSPAALAGILRWRAPRVVYVSCDPPTLARDARQFLSAGYELSAVEAFDFFPNTPHVETLAVFDERR